MTKKRKQPDSNSSDTLFTSKRSRPNQPNGTEDAPSATQARIDPTYGQRGAFPGLDGPVPGEDELFYGPANDGLEYLRMVRSEAKSVPNLLVAPISLTAPNEREDIYSDYPQGYYADGAYTALPPPSSVSTFHSKRKAEESSESSETDPQDSYYTSLLTRFHTLSTHLHNPPALPANGILNIPSGFNTRKSWRNKLLRTQPKMGILALLQQEMVIMGLDVFEEVLTMGNLRREAGRGVGLWAWGLLARCREVGTMGSEEVGVLRRVGKRGVWLLRRLRAGSVIEDEGVKAEGEEENTDEDADGEQDRVGDGEEDEDEEDEDEDDVDVASDIVDEVTADTTEVIDTIDPVTSLSQPSTSAGLLAPPTPHPPTADTAIPTAIEAAKARILASLEPTQDIQTEKVNQNPDHQYPHRHQRSQDPDPDTVSEIDGDKVEVMEKAGNKVQGMDEMDMHATLDMIVTVVGEVYGQRDLLDGRVLWGEV